MDASWNCINRAEPIREYVAGAIDLSGDIRAGSAGFTRQPVFS